MTVKSIIPALNASANTTRGPSEVIWGSCPVLDFIEHPGLGMHFFDDFLVSGNATMSSAYAGSVGGWTVYGYAGSQVNDGQLEGGVIKVGADGDDEGIAYLSSSGAFRFVTTSTLALNRRMWFEARWARSSITTDITDVFVGLMKPAFASGLPVVAQPLLSASDDTLSTAVDLFGFHSNSNTGTRGGPTEIAAAFELTSGTVNYPTNLTTLMASSGNSVLTAGAYVKTGFLFDPNAAPKLITTPTARQTAGQVKKAIIRFFINGLELPTFLTTDDVVNATATQAFPTGFMSPCFAVMNTAAGTDTLNMDWIRVAQEANS